MKNIVTYKLLYKFFVLAGLSLCLWAVSARTKSTQQVDRFIPVVITEQLEAKNGVIPVYLSCGQARLSAPNRLEEFHCALKNNTNLKVTAVNAIYSILIEQNGSTSKDTVNYTIERFVHADFSATNKLMAPSEETDIGPPGPISYKNDFIVGVEISIDYVEFENNTSLGPDKEGSRIIRAMRVGAQKYKSWLKVRYKTRGGSIAAVASDIETTQSLPAELQLTDFNEQQGAIAYRRRLEKLIQTSGPAEAKRLLDSK